jgi:rod shape-determining protein MreD
MAYARRAIFTKSRETQWRGRVIIGGGLLLSVLHALLLPRLGLEDFTPDLYTVGALFIGLFASRSGRYGPSLVFGLIRDFFSLGLLGSYAVLYSLLHKAAGRAREKFDPYKPANVFTMALIGTFLVNFGYHGMLALAGDGVGWSRALTRCACMAVASAPVAVLAYPGVHFALEKLGARNDGGYWNF